MNLIERLRDYGGPDTDEAAEALELAYKMLDHLCLGAVEWHTEIERLTAERDALKSALQLIKANTNTLDWPDDINAAMLEARK